MLGDPVAFEATFQVLLAGRTPFRWQRRLLDRLAAGRIPLTCTLPTGLGKTSIIPIWLLALAHSVGNGARLPRRLVYIVNRRTVVDQATEDAARILERLSAPDSSNGPLGSLRTALATLASDDSQVPVAVSTLRGELADNGEWKKNPARAAIVIGTIDMIGSKLLFSGYGDGRYGRAHHAGLIGQDTLIVHDEAHLSPAFSRLLWKIEREQREAHEPKPVRVLELTATSRDDAREDREAVRRLRGEGTDADFTLIEEDGDDTIVAQRRTASKTLTLQPCDAGKGKLAEAIAAQALTYRDSKARILIYVRSPDEVKGIADAIKRKRTGLGKVADGRVRLLTGTIRGFERDQLAKSDLFRAFKSDPARPLQLEQTLYLVSTSAGEVGADLDADNLVCDLTTLDSMAQRFGRVNRLGGAGRSAEVMVLCEKPNAGAGSKKRNEPSPLDVAVAKTGDLLRKVAETGGDVSPAALAKLLESPDAKAAFSPSPTVLPATDILFDSWALTSLMGDLPGRPEVGPYLHGVAEWEPPETHVAWRADIGELDRAGVKEDDLAEMLEAFPIRAAERLRDTAGRVLEQFVAIAGRCPEARAVLIKDGEPRWITLANLAPTGRADTTKLNDAVRLLSYAIVLLPTEVGGLKDGMLDGKSETPVADVAEASLAGQAVRQRVRVTGEEKKALLDRSVESKLVERCTLTLSGSDSEDEDASPVTIEYRVAKAESGEPGKPVLLAEHTKDAEATAQRIAGALGLSGDIAEVLALAGRWHDHGKARERWQKYARNPTPQEPATALAKSKSYGDPTKLGGYRHEFGSLHAAAVDPEIASHPEQDLILHLIATHHGWARPHFRHNSGASAHDPMHTTSENQQAAAKAMRRFARLQRRFGRWALAWLESLLRCADAMASAHAQDGGER